MTVPVARRRRVALILPVLGFAVLAGCGRKGPPLPPLRPQPGRLAELAVRRLGNQVELRFTIPGANADNTTPPVVSRIDVYARSVPEGPARPTPAQVMLKANLVGSIAVKPPVDEEKTPASDKGQTGAKAAPPPAPPQTAAPPDTRPSAGDPVRFVTTIPPDAPQPLPPLKTMPPPPAPVAAATAKPAAPPVAVPATRYFLLMPVSRYGQLGQPTDLIGVPLIAMPERPRALAFAYDEKTLTVTWDPVAPPAAPATATPPATGAAAAAGTPAPAAVTYQIYDAVDATGKEKDGRRLSASPLAKPAFQMPVQFGAEHCFAVRTAVVSGAVSLESDPVGGCTTPKDTFPPPTPSGFVQPFLDGPAVTLRWDAVTAADLAGYVVLRRDGPNGTLQRLTPTPIADTTYRDTDVRAGATYVYTVVAVDKAGNQSPESEARTVVVR